MKITFSGGPEDVFEGPERYEGVLQLMASRGNISHARRAIGKAIRKALGVRKWGEAPNWVFYHSSREIERDTGDPDATPQYSLNVTREEWDDLSEELKRQSYIAGFDGTVAEAYFDTMP